MVSDLLPCSNPGQGTTVGIWLSGTSVKGLVSIRKQGGDGRPHPAQPEEFGTSACPELTRETGQPGKCVASPWARRREGGKGGCAKGQRLGDRVGELPGLLTN